MNGKPLPAAHGFPLRAIVPGWYGMASVKWLQRLIVTDRPFNGYYQSIDYAYWKREENLPVLVPLAEMQVKAEIARPGNNEIVSANSKYHVRGAAWTAAAVVTKVGISCDGGKSCPLARHVRTFATTLPLPSRSERAHQSLPGMAPQIP